MNPTARTFLVFAAGFALALALGAGLRAQSQPQPEGGASTDPKDALFRMYESQRTSDLARAGSRAIVAASAPKDGWALIVSPSGSAYIVSEDGRFRAVTGVGTLLGLPEDLKSPSIDPPRERVFNFITGTYNASYSDFVDHR